MNRFVRRVLFPSLLGCIVAPFVAIAVFWMRDGLYAPVPDWLSVTISASCLAIPALVIGMGVVNVAARRRTRKPEDRT